VCDHPTGKRGDILEGARTLDALATDPVAGIDLNTSDNSTAHAIHPSPIRGTAAHSTPRKSFGPKRIAVMDGGQVVQGESSSTCATTARREVASSFFSREPRAAVT